MDESTGIFLLGAVMGGVFTYYICNRSKSTSSGAHSRKLISNQEAKQLVSSADARGNGDHISGCIPIDVILSYIDSMKSSLALKALTLSGLEFYFGKHDENHAETPNKTTFFLYPTVLDESTGENVPVDPMASSSSSLITFKDVNKTTKHDKNLIGLNRSNMSPPRGNTF